MNDDPNFVLQDCQRHQGGVRDRVPQQRGRQAPLRGHDRAGPNVIKLFFVRNLPIFVLS